MKTKQWFFKLGAIILAVCLAVSLGMISASAETALYTAVGGAKAEGGVTFVSDWAQKATSKTPVKLDGLSVTFTNVTLGGTTMKLGIGLSKSADGVALGSTGEGVLFKLMYSGSDSADVMPMNINNWHDTDAPADTAWVHNSYLGAGIWPSYTFSVKKNGANYEFWVNEKLVTSVPTETVEALTGTDPYISFYMWNNAGGKVTIADVNGSAPDPANYNLSGSTMTDNGVKISADWNQSVKYSEKVYLDGFSIMVTNLTVGGQYARIGLGFTKDEAGINMDGSKGNGVLFKLMNSGTNEAVGQNFGGVMPMNIDSWNSAEAPAGTAWKHEEYVGDGIWDSYTFSIKKNGDNYEFWINEKTVRSVPAADVLTLINEDGSAYLNLYAWNAASISYVVSDIANGKALETTTEATTTTTTEETTTTTEEETTTTSEEVTTTTTEDTTTTEEATTTTDAATTTTTAEDTTTTTTEAETTSPGTGENAVIPMVMMAVLLAGAVALTLTKKAKGQA